MCIRDRQYIASHMNEISFELSKHFGLVPDIETIELIEVNQGTYEIYKISSLGGVVWLASRLDELESPRFFKTYSDLINFKSRGDII